MKVEEFRDYRDSIREIMLKYTRKAFMILPKMTSPCILDIGCGSGVPTLELARLSSGKIIAIDINQRELERLARKVKEFGMETRIEIKNISMFELDFPAGTFDVIWAEGSIAVMGFQTGISNWRRFLKTGGHLVVHDDLGDLEGKKRQISLCGYELIDYFVLNNDIWWDEYYLLLADKLKKMHDEDAIKPDIATEIKSDQQEVDGFKENPERYRSVYFVMKKTDRLI